MSNAIFYLHFLFCIFIFVLLGQRPANLDQDAVYEGAWIPDDAAADGAPRELFVQCVLRRFCGPMIEKLKLPPGTIYATEFILASDPAQISIVDQLLASLLGYNWSMVGFLACTDNPEQNRLDTISRFEYVKARDFLENWLRTEGYRCLRPGPKSIEFHANLYESVQWKSGVIIGIEATGPRDFYQINQTFVKCSVNEVMHRFGSDIWNSSSLLDFSRKVAIVSMSFHPFIVYVLSCA